MTVRKFLDISTGHLTQETRDALDANSYQWSIYTLEHGWLVWVPDSPEDPGNEMRERLPEDLVACILYARGQGCDYIMFDADAGYCDELRAYDGESEAEHEAGAIAEAEAEDALEIEHKVGDSDYTPGEG